MLRTSRKAHTRLIRVGLGRVIGYSLADEAQWRKEGIDLASISIQRCANVRQTLEHDPSVQLVDVRSRAEWLKGHLPGAISLPLLDLDPKKRIIDPSKPSLVYCHEGYRATTATSILLRESAGDIRILIDGVEGWLALGLQVTALSVQAPAGLTATRPIAAVTATVRNACKPAAGLMKNLSLRKNFSFCLVLSTTGSTGGLSAPCSRSRVFAQGGGRVDHDSSETG